MMNVTVKTPTTPPSSLPNSPESPSTPAKPNTTILPTKGFLITKAEPAVVFVRPGERVTLFCAVDGRYEWCNWFHPGGEFCTFEWKRSEDNITMQECALHDRISFYGDYDLMECGISFTAQQQDTGLWRLVTAVRSRARPIIGIISISISIFQNIVIGMIFISENRYR